MSALLCVSPCPGAVARGGVGGGSHTGMAGRHVSSSSSAARRRGPRERCGPQSTRAPDRAASPSQLKHCFESSYYEIYVIPTNGMHCLASESKFRDNKSRGGVERGACRPDGRRKLGLRNLKPLLPPPPFPLSLSRSLALSLSSLSVSLPKLVAWNIGRRKSNDALTDTSMPERLVHCQALTSPASSSAWNLSFSMESPFFFQAQNSETCPSVRVLNNRGGGGGGGSDGADGVGA